ncbi:MAG: ribonuclease III [bacterium]|nr:ribonuclease III [bacterium]
MKQKPNLDQLEKILGIHFRNQNLLLTALTHRSFINEANKNISSNERMEFLGDAILEFVVSDYLYKTFKDQPEGNLTTLRSKIVCTKTLSQKAKQLNLGSFLLLSRGEESGGGRDNPNLLADLFEAIIGAIYLDQGLKTVSDFIHKHLLADFSNLPDLDSIKSAKTLLQELLQEKFKQAPVYKVIEEKKDQEAADHFTVGVYLGDRLLGIGQGKNKKAAQEAAARSALAKIS